MVWYDMIYDIRYDMIFIKYKWDSELRWM